MTKNWFITGATSGFGRSLAEAALARGDTVIAAVRRPAALEALARTYPDRLDVATLDVADTSADTAIMREALTRHGHVDVLVNNAGKGLIGGAEEVSEQELRDLFDLQVHGPIALCRAVLPSMRERGSGLIVQMSSNAGRLSFPAVSAYSATKFALEGWSEALQQEVTPFGVRVVIVEPGAFRTRFHGSSLEFPSTRIAAYDPILDQVRSTLAAFDGAQPGDPAKAPPSWSHSPTTRHRRCASSSAPTRSRRSATHCAPSWPILPSGRRRHEARTSPRPPNRPRSIRRRPGRPHPGRRPAGRAARRDRCTKSRC